jgi:hypothetical protein
MGKWKKVPAKDRKSGYMRTQAIWVAVDECDSLEDGVEVEPEKVAKLRDRCSDFWSGRLLGLPWAEN